MNRKKRVERLQIMLNEDELAVIDDWRFEQRMPTRSAAVRALMLLGIERTREMRLPGLAKSAATSEIGLMPVKDNTSAYRVESKRTILVVEDQSLIGQGIQNVLEGAGFAVLGPVTEKDEAMRILAEHTPSAAVVDLQLGNGVATSLLRVLIERNIPLVYCTSYDPASILPKDLWKIPAVEKHMIQTELPEKLKLLGTR